MAPHQSRHQADETFWAPLLEDDTAELARLAGERTVPNSAPVMAPRPNRYQDDEAFWTTLLAGERP
jgi:hypothetical protein